MLTTAAIRQAYAYIVRSDSGHVVVALSGADAEEEAEQWAARGYLVEAVERDELGI